MIAKFEQYDSNSNLITFRDLKEAFEKDQLNYPKEFFGQLTDAFENMTDDDELDSPICDDEDIYDLGHEYHDYSFTVIELTIHLGRMISYPFMIVFEDEKPSIILPNYGGFFLFHDILVLYCPFSIITVNLLSNKCKLIQGSDDIVEVEEEGGAYKIKWLRSEKVIECNYEGEKVHYYKVSHPIMDLEPFRIN